MGFSTAAHRNLIPRKEDAIVQLSSKSGLKYTVEKPSDEYANGDSAEDKEISDTDDVADHNVQDMGFSTAAHRNLIPRNDDAIVQLYSLTGKKLHYKVTKPSDEVANGDTADDKEISDTDDQKDHNVQDYGFGIEAHRNTLPKNKGISQIKAKSLAHKPKNNSNVQYTVEKPSDEFANGDSAEDKEISDTDDVNDHNVQDMGFSTAAHRNLIPRKDDAIVQLESSIQMKSQSKNKMKYTVEKPSDEYANGDSAEDKEISDTDDVNDHNV